jgi:phenylacetate-CoA ligase
MPAIAPAASAFCLQPVNQLPEYGGEYRIVITREGAMDELLIRIEAAPSVQGEEAVNALRAKAVQKLQAMLGLRPIRNR